MKLPFYKLLIFCPLFLLSAKTIFSQTHLKLILHTTEPIDSVYIAHFTNQESIRITYNDTIEVNFKTGGIDFYHINYKIANGKNYFAPAYLDSGNITIISHIENEKLIIDSVAGSAIYKTYQYWRTSYTNLKANNDSVALDSFLLKTYEANSDNMFSFQIGLRYLDIHQNNKLKLYALLPLMAKQDSGLRDLFGYSMLHGRLQGILKNDVLLLSDYQLIDLKNKKTYAQAAKVKFVILDFWFVGCVPCMADHQKIAKLLPQLKQQQTEFISISNDNSYKTWKNYLVKHEFKWQHYKKSEANSIIDQLGIATYPTYILLDRDGKILYSTYSLEEILAQVKFQ